MRVPGAPTFTNVQYRHTIYILYISIFNFYGFFAINFPADDQKSGILPSVTTAGAENKPSTQPKLEADILVKQETKDTPDLLQPRSNSKSKSPNGATASLLFMAGIFDVCKEKVAAFLLAHACVWFGLLLDCW